MCLHEGVLELSCLGSVKFANLLALGLPLASKSSCCVMVNNDPRNMSKQISFRLTDFIVGKIRVHSSNCLVALRTVDNEGVGWTRGTALLFRSCFSFRAIGRSDIFKLSWVLVICIGKTDLDPSLACGE